MHRMEVSILAGWKFVAYHPSLPYRFRVLWEAAQSYAQGLGAGFDLRRLKALWDAVVGIGVDLTTVTMTCHRTMGPLCSYELAPPLGNH